MNMTQEDFQEWLENPATRQVLASLKTQAAFMRELWTARAWSAVLMSPEDQLSMNNYKVESEVFERLSKMTYNDFLQWNERV